MTRMVGEGGKEWKRVMNSGREGKEGSFPRSDPCSDNKQSDLFIFLGSACPVIGYSPPLQRSCVPAQP